MTFKIMQYIRPAVCFAYSNRFFNYFLSNQFKHNHKKQGFKEFRKCQTSIVMFSLSLFSTKGADSSIGGKKKQEIITEADRLFSSNENRKLCTLLEPYKDSDDVELLWRLARAQYTLAQELATSPEEKKSLIFDAFHIIERSLALNDNHFANHKWMSILLDAHACYFGTKARITQLEIVKSHMMRAIELNPKDATTLYMLGVWCFEIADMPWYKRQIAGAVFAKPPNSSYEEALEYFIRAEETEPRFYSLNLLMLGKTYLRLKNMDKARYYLDLASNYPPAKEDDQKAIKEARDLLKSL